MAASPTSNQADDATDGAGFAAVNPGLNPWRVVKFGVRRLHEIAARWQGPADMAARNSVDRNSVDRTGTRNSPTAAHDATQQLRAGGVTSRPLSLGEAIDAATNPTRAGARLIKNHLGRALTSGALTGAAIGGSFSAISNFIALREGKKSGATATVDTLKDAASSSATGAAIGGIALATESALLRAGAVGVATGAAPVAIALTAVDVGKDAGRLLMGRIDRAAFVHNSSRHIAKGGLTWAGMEGGAAVGTALTPGIGTALGAVIGGIAGSLLGGWLSRR